MHEAFYHTAQPVFVVPGSDVRPGLREYDRTFSESYPAYLSAIVERRLTVPELGLRWIADLPRAELIRRVREYDHLVMATNRADEELARDERLPYVAVEDYLSPCFLPRDQRRNVTILNTDLTHHLMLHPEQLQLLVDRLEASLLLPVTVPTVEFTALWDAGWSGPRAGAFSHRRLNDLRRPASVTLLSDAPDWHIVRLSFKVWTNHPTDSVLRLTAPLGYHSWELRQNLTSVDANVWIRPGRTTLNIEVSPHPSGTGAFVDVGDLQIEHLDRAQPAHQLRPDVDDDGTYLTASLPAALRRLHSFGFLGSRFDVYCRGSRIDALSGTATTRMSDLSPVIAGSPHSASDDAGAPHRATALVRLLRTERP